MGAWIHHTDSWEPIGLLRARRKRPRHRRAAEKCDELAAFHVCSPPCQTSHSSTMPDGMLPCVRRNQMVRRCDAMGQERPICDGRAMFAFAESGHSPPPRRTVKYVADHRLEA